MLAILSPAKKLNEKKSFPENLTFSDPVFADKAELLVNRLKKFSSAQLAEFMGISDKLAELNMRRLKEWTPQGIFPAVYLYDGDTYKGLDIESFPEDQLDELQSHIRIISGLYGLLRPLDLIMPYRLEMKRTVPGSESINLKDFWREPVTAMLHEELQGRPLIALASKEYASVIDPGKLDAPFVQVDFKDFNRGAYRTIGLHAKRARGNMARWIALNKPEKIEDLQAFDGLGYRFAPEVSSENRLVFTRRK